jgi:hypothetical protein
VCMVLYKYLELEKFKSICNFIKFHKEHIPESIVFSQLNVLLVNSVSINIYIYMQFSSKLHIAK